MTDNAKAPSRRDLVKLLGLAGTAAIVGPTALRSTKAAAAGASDKFLIYIHAGSWDGLAAGLIQPRDAGIWQRGLFAPNEAGGSMNPNVNTHHKIGNLVLNNYTKPLAAIADHVCFGVGTPRSAAHAEAQSYQVTGSKEPGTSPSWVAGFAAALASGAATSPIITTSTMISEQSVGLTARNVALVNGSSLAAFRANFDDSPLIPKGAAADRFWGVLAGIHERRFAPSNPGESHSRSANAYVSNLVRGQPRLVDTAPEVIAVQAAFNRTRINAVIDRDITDANDGAEVKKRAYDDLMRFLQLCGVLAATGAAKGASFTLDNQDYHFGGSSITTARSGAQVFAQIATFWKQFVIPQGLHDKIMIVVSHEFSRTAYNNIRPAAGTVMHNGALVPVEAPGVDHNFVNGVVFINGKVPGKSRVGGVGDYYAALGSRGLDGIAQPGMAAYTSTQLVGSMLMRCFGDVFPTEREVRANWRDFSPVDMVVA